ARSTVGSGLAGARGITMDAANQVLVALRDGKAVVRIDPATGAMSTVSSRGIFGDPNGLAVVPDPPVPAPAPAQCEADLAAIQSRIQSLESQLATANVTIADQAATITSLITDVFGGRPDANVAAAARDAAQTEIQAAIAKVGAADPRVVRAQRKFNEGLGALAEGDISRAVTEFRQAFDIASRVS